MYTCGKQMPTCLYKPITGINVRLKEAGKVRESRLILSPAWCEYRSSADYKKDYGLRR